MEALAAGGAAIALLAGVGCAGDDGPTCEEWLTRPVSAEEWETTECTVRGIRIPAHTVDCHDGRTLHWNRQVRGWGGETPQPLPDRQTSEDPLASSAPSRTTP